MIELPIISVNGEEVGKFEVDESWFGGRVNKDLLRRAVLMYEANRRVGTAATKTRGMVVGSTRKLFRQKGTGRARMGSKRTGIRRGGGNTFGKQARSFRQRLPKQARRAALDSALLAKFIDGETMVLDGLDFAEPKTKQMAAVLQALKVNGRRCLLAIKEPDEAVWKSGRNIPRLAVMSASDLNAEEVLKARHLIMARDAVEALVEVRKK
ncbi:MAG: 50S ribosomal protein L4 [Phycisphaerae bacterium]|nr:50S ribosomal protein L4 [Phycisphaerae bacterium]